MSRWSVEIEDRFQLKHYQIMHVDSTDLISLLSCVLAVAISRCMHPRIHGVWAMVGGMAPPIIP